MTPATINFGTAKKPIIISFLASKQKTRMDYSSSSSSSRSSDDDEATFAVLTATVSVLTGAVQTALTRKKQSLWNWMLSMILEAVMPRTKVVHGVVLYQGELKSTETSRVHTQTY
jgi:hypothetical protein